jgi:hypothetical protein
MLIGCMASAFRQRANIEPENCRRAWLGKTTLTCAAARATGREVYIFQCTMDTRPEDLVITPVLTEDKQIEYRASAVVTAMIQGGVVLLLERQTGCQLARKYRRTSWQRVDRRYSCGRPARNRRQVQNELFDLRPS